MEKETFIIEDYDKKAPFAGFLPGLAGIHGIPIWCYYVNRGQCISSFGVEDKDHSIMEFFPAHQAYQNTAFNGFRTFVKKDGSYHKSRLFYPARRKNRCTCKKALHSEYRKRKGAFTGFRWNAGYDSLWS